MRGWRSIIALLTVILLIGGAPLAAACAAACDTARMQMSCPPQSGHAVVMASMECDHCHGKAQQDEVSVSCSTMHGKTATVLQANSDEETAHAPAALHAVVAMVAFLMPRAASVHTIRIEPPGVPSPPRASLTPLRI